MRKDDGWVSMRLVEARVQMQLCDSLPGPTSIRSHSPIGFPLGQAIGAVAMQKAGSPVLIPDHTASLTELRSPVTEDIVPQLDEITMLGVVRVSESPGELATNWLLSSGQRVWIRRQNGEWEVLGNRLR